MISRWEDDELGCLVARVRTNAKQLVFHVKPDAVYITVPLGTTLEMIKRELEKLRPRLLVARQQVVTLVIDWNFRIDTESFKLELIPGKGARFLIRSQEGINQLVCPLDTDFTDVHLQQWLHKVVVELLKRTAKQLLPVRLEQLSKQTGLVCSQVKINSSKGRWGSCSGKKIINLSCYLILLPVHLQDYVLLHELCHTREMNHGERFWALLDQFTEKKSLALRKEMKKYSTELSGFAAS